MATTEPSFTREDLIRFYRENHDRYVEILVEKLRAHKDDWNRFDFAMRLEPDGSVRITIYELMEQYREKILPEALSESIMAFIETVLLPSD